MAEEIKVEIVEREIVGDNVLDLARQTMHKSIVRRERIRRIYKVGIPILAAILIILIPVMIHLGNSQTNDIHYWSSFVEQVNVEYEDLEKHAISSIKDLNKEKDGHFYWLDNMEKTESYILKYNDTTAVIEEHYIYEGIECIFYISNKESNIIDIDIQTKYLQSFFKPIEKVNLNYGIFENEYYAKFISDYMYQIKINSTDIDSIETILSNLTNN